MSANPDEPGDINRRYPSRGARASASDNNSTPRSRGSRRGGGVPPTIRKNTRTHSYVPQPIQGIVPTVASTPIASPATSPGPPPYSSSNTIRDHLITPGPLRHIINDEMSGAYQTTPISESAGAVLVSNLPAIPQLSEQTSPNELLALLDILCIHIDNYGSNLTNAPNWKQLVHLKYKDLLDLLTPAQNCAIDLNHHGLMTRCTDLMSKLEENKMKLALKCAGESSISSFHGYPSMLHNDRSLSRDVPVLDNPDLLARIVSLEQLAFKTNKLGSHFSALAERISILENVDLQSLLLRIETVEHASSQTHANFEQLQCLEARVVAAEGTQQLILQSIDSLKGSAFKYQDSIKSLTRGLSMLQTSVSTDLSIIKQNIEEIGSGPLPPVSEPTVLRQVGITPQVNTCQPPSFVPQIFQPPITNPCRTTADIQPPVYTTAPVSSNNLLVSHWLDSNNFSSIAHALPQANVNIPSMAQENMPPAQEETHNLRNREQPMTFGAPPAPIHNSLPRVSTGREVPQVPRYSSLRQDQIQSLADDRRSNASNSTGEGSRLSALNIQGKMLKSQMQGLKGLLSPPPSDDLSKGTLLDLHKNKITAVENQTQNLQRSLKDYLRFDGHGVELCEEVAATLNSAISWSSRIRDLYQSKGAHKKSQGGKLYDTIPRFSSSSEIDIFNFLKRFESSTEEFDYDSEKSELLYNKFLSSAIQEEMIKYKNNYFELKRNLIHRYGDPKTILTSLLNPVRKESLPQSTSNVLTSLSYYRKLQSALEKISALLKSQELINQDMEAYVTSTEFLHSLLTLVPLDAKGEFFKQMNRCNEDTIRIRGITPFRLILSSVNEYYEFHDRLSRTHTVASAPKGRRDYDRSRQSRSHHTVAIQDSSDIESESSSDCDSDSDQGFFNPSQVNFQKGGRDKSELRPPKPICKQEFPCVLPDHKHNISDCREFFLKSPKERAELRKSFKYKHCLVCLQSSSCTYRKCENLSSVPKTLICRDCKNDQKNNKNLRVYSVLFCFREDHHKPANTDLLKALESYIPGFKASTLKTPISLISHFQVMNLTKGNSKPKSLSSPVDDRDTAPIFNTNTGDKEDPHDLDLIDEIREDSIAVMQTLNINGRLVLTIYDRGANQHLVEGKLAEELGFKSINQNVSAIGVVSGGNIWTDYGSYQTYLGPSPNGKYFEINCQGISTITSSFPKYDLSNVNAEALEYSDLPPDTKLPPYIGGDRVGLLVGLKACELEPECIFTLPSGVGLYRSQFCDAFGSRYCFGGPNRSFTAVNKRFNGNVSFLKVFLTQAISQYRNSLYPSLLDKLSPEIVDSGCGFSRIADPALTYSFESYCGQNVMPTPLTSDDFRQLGQPVDDEADSSSSLCPNVHCTCLSSTNVLKAKVPLSKQRSYLDEQDMDDTVNYKCSKCQRCKCSSSNKEKMISLNEATEQRAIENSVSINLEKQRVEVDLPFVVDPDKFLSEKHGGMDNYNQARRVYKSQCRLPESSKVGIRASISDLQEKGFLKKLSDLPPEHQALIGNNRFMHYMPWRVINKQSESTPVRPVVDPSMSGLNLCLAKGENRLRRINDILLRARCHKYVWSSDISKLYNRLFLKPSSYTYQLFLYHSSLDPDVPPEVFVMVVCWYGVSSSANQSCFALEELARLHMDQYPLAYAVISNDTYVDDMISGSSSEDTCKEQIRQVIEVLKSGGFQTKFVIQSGQPIEGEFLRILGYRWSVAKDFLSPGFTEINFSKKKRGLKEPLPFPVEKPSDVTKLLESVDISRRMVISKIAELFDPLGLWEAYKFQLKLSSNTLNGLDWDKALPKDYQDFWLNKFQEFLQVSSMRLDRYVFPSHVTVDKIRLICVSDAAANAGGGIVYAGVKLPDGSYSCKLLSSRSKIMKESVPRNELDSIRVVAGLAFDVKHSLGEKVSDIVFVTDSTIALSWCHNLDKQLRLFVFNRVSEVRRLIQAVTGDTDCLPLYHIDGKLNPADLITKPSKISPKDLTEDSVWVNGFDWMTKPFDQMPLTSYEKVCVSAQHKQIIGSECFPDAILPSQNVLYGSTNPEIRIHCSGCEIHANLSASNGCLGNSFEDPHCLHCTCVITSFSLAAKAGKGDEPFVNVIKHGYAKSLRIISKVFDYRWSLGHKAHLSKEVNDFQDCRKCTAIAACNGIPIEYEKYLLKEAKNYLFRKESSRLVSCMPKAKLKQFCMKDGILYCQSRLPEDAKVITQDLDFNVFFDGQDINSVLPVVSTDSDLFYSILMHVHHVSRKHSGNEATIREIMKVIFPLGNANRIISLVRKHCPRCRIILRKTFELEMGNHPQSRFQLVPAFYHSMADIAYGFAGKQHKNSRTFLKVYALIIVCLLTSATSILALEGIQTQDIVMAIERHSGRHGVPAALYVDQGTQLTNLDKLEGTLRDANLQVRTSLGLKIIPSLPKNHQQRGKVERKIRSLRDMLKKVAINTDNRLTPLEWETVFQKMSSQIDDLPMARSDKLSSSEFGWELLTPNRFKLGRNNNRAIEGCLVVNDNTTPTQLLKRVHDIQRYWYQLLLDRLHHLIPRLDNVSQSGKVNLEDIVCFRFIDNVNSKLEIWKLGKVVEIVKGGQGVIISYSSVSPNGKTRMSCVSRSPRDVVIISSVDDLGLNSVEFFNKIKKISA